MIFGTIDVFQDDPVIGFINLGNVIWKFFTSMITFRKYSLKSSFRIKNHFSQFRFSRSPYDENSLWSQESKNMRTFQFREVGQESSTDVFVIYCLLIKSTTVYDRRLFFAAAGTVLPDDKYNEAIIDFNRIFRLFNVFPFKIFST